MNNIEINTHIAKIEGLKVEGINEAGQVFVRTKGKYDRLYNPVQSWGESGHLIEKHQVEIVCNGFDVWSAKCVMMGTWNEAESPLKASMLAIIKSFDKAK